MLAPAAPESRLLYNYPSVPAHTVRFDVSIYRPIGEPDATNEQMTHLFKLDTFFHTHNARIMTHDALRIRTTHRVNLALEYRHMRAKHGADNKMGCCNKRRTECSDNAMGKLCVCGNFVVSARKKLERNWLY